ncbi:MAG TPA: HAD family hydrolase [Anaerolineae bacterium]|nr:HAD family hydrolase [Anaerolineae bacterium]HOQ97754.1 HAD family hydrolase [Anaerolineae bacterium]HPL30631.1 HAD family hydrolase [Anaerolineae bacterium]
MAQGPVAAFFDLDHTVLTRGSASLWARFEYREGRLSRGQFLRLAWWNLQYRLAVIDMAVITRRLAASMRGQSEAELIARSNRWFEEMVRPCIAEGAVKRIREHMAEGHTVALLTASTPYVSAPVCHALGLDERYICTRLEVQGGLFTGRCIEPICFGPGKVYWARAFAAEHRLDLAQSYFYTDSYTDLAMLLAVAHPVAVNPDARLRHHATRTGWPVERFY